jgi:hypothetical protein
VTPAELLKAAAERRAVLWAVSNRPMPAVFLANMPFSVVMRGLRSTKLYKPQTKKAPKYYDHTTSN